MSAATRVNEFVTDTMGLVLRVESRRPSTRVRRIFEAADLHEAVVYIPTVVFAEILYLSVRGRIEVTLNRAAEFLQQYSGYQEFPLSLAVAQSAAEIRDVPELHDRLIAGTARLLGLTLITSDPIMEASRFVRTVW